MISKIPIITVDGPSSAGKGTLCKALAKLLKWNLLDSGIIYRILALKIINYKISIKNKKDLIFIATNINVFFQLHKEKFNILLKEISINKNIRNENISNIASKISVCPYIRKALLYYQHSFLRPPGLIADGRDMGTIVFPEASVKIFLNASLKERACRRMYQLQKKGFNVNFNYMLSEIKKRDDRDRYREVSPLIPAADAFFIDSTNLTINEMIDKALKYSIYVFHNYHNIIINLLRN